MWFSKAQNIFLHTSQITCIVTSLYVYNRENTQWYLMLFIYFACFFTYNIERVYQKSPEDIINHPQRRIYLQKNQTAIRCACFLSILSCLYLVFFLSKSQVITLIIASIPTFLYLSPKLYFSKKRLKEVFLAKEFSIAFSWALITAVLPYPELNFKLFILCFILAFINVIACDQLDQKGDSKNKIKTLANTSEQANAYIYLSCSIYVILCVYLNEWGFALALIHILLAKKIHASHFQYDLALIWPALIVLQS